MNEWMNGDGGVRVYGLTLFLGKKKLFLPGIAFLFYYAAGDILKGLLPKKFMKNFHHCLWK